MPRHKTGGAVYKIVQKGKKKKKIWYARIQFFDDFGKRRQRHRKPDYNSESSARAQRRERCSPSSMRIQDPSMRLR